MATFGRIYPTGDVSTSNLSFSTGSTGWDLIDDNPASGQPDSDYVSNDATESNATLYMDFTNPSDFDEITSLQWAMYCTGISSGDDDLTLDITVTDSSGTALTEVDTAFTHGTTSDGLVTGTFTTLNSPTNKTTWDDAQIRLDWTYTQNGGADDLQIRVYAVELQGNYTSSDTDFVDLEYDSFDDENGLFYWIGIEEGNMATPTYANALFDRNVDTRVDTWSGTAYPSEITDRVSPAVAGSRYISDNVANQFLYFALPGEMRVEGYHMRNSFDGQNSPRSWVLEGYNPNDATPDWVLLDTHSSDSTLNTAGEDALFIPTENDTGYYQKLRIRQTGVNSHANNYLVIDELEFYGRWKGLDELNPCPPGMADCRFRSDNDPSNDTGGIFYYVGTDGLTTSYTNPVDESGTAITASDQDGGTVTQRVADHDINTSGGRWGDWSNSNNDPWIKFDFDDGNGEKVVPIGFSYYPGYDLNHVWEEGDIQGSNNDSDWDDLMVYDGSGEEKHWGAHTDDIVSYFSMDNVTDSTQYRYIRFRQTGPNRAGNYYFTANHIEFYGYYGVESEPSIEIDLDGEVITGDTTVYNPSIDPGAVDIDLTGEVISDGTTVYNPTISATGVSQDIDLDGQVITGGTTVYNPSIDPGAVDIDLAGEIIAATATVYNPSVDAITDIDLSGEVVASTAAVYNPTLSPGVADIDLTDEIISDGTTVYNPTVVPGNVDIDLSGQIIAATTTVYNPEEVAATTLIDLDGEVIADGTTVYNPVLTPGAVDINLDGEVIDGTVIYAPSVDVPAVTITPVLIESTATIPAVTINVTIRPARIESTAEVFAPTVEGTDADINLSGQIITSTAQVFTPDWVVGEIVSVLVSQQIDIKTINQIISVLTKDQTITALETGQVSEAGTSSTNVEGEE